MAEYVDSGRINNSSISPKLLLRLNPIHQYTIISAIAYQANILSFPKPKVPSHSKCTKALHSEGGFFKKYISEKLQTHLTFISSTHFPKKKFLKISQKTTIQTNSRAIKWFNLDTKKITKRLCKRRHWLLSQ